MKMRLLSTLVSTLVLSTAVSLADSYSIGPLNANFNYLVANQLNHAGGNSIANLFPPGSLPELTEIMIPDCSGTFAYYFSDSGSPSGWDNRSLNNLSLVDAAAITLNPGD